jgi:hypothetical protein
MTPEPHILAIDGASVTGWARWHPEMAKPVSGAHKLASSSTGALLASYRDFLVGKLLEGVTHIAYERPYVNPKAAPVNAEILYGLFAMAQEAAYRRKLGLNLVTSFAWRFHFIGVKQAPKAIKPNKRRDWLKDRATDVCREKGWAFASADEAEALGILDYERSRLLPVYGATGPLFQQHAFV